MKVKRIEKLPNRITIFRMFLIILFIPLLLKNTFISSYLSLLIFIIASVSDFLDGYIARKYNIVSDFGKIMDPLADKILVISALICFVQLNIIPAWMVIVIISRDFLISGIRIMAAQEGKIIVASKWGKTKTVIEIIVIITILVLLALNNTIEYYEISRDNFVLFGWTFSELILLKIIPYWLMFIAAMISLISGLDYFFKNIKIFEKDL